MPHLHSLIIVPLLMGVSRVIHTSPNILDFLAQTFDNLGSSFSGINTYIKENYFSNIINTSRSILVYVQNLDRYRELLNTITLWRTTLDLLKWRLQLARLRALMLHELPVPNVQGLLSQIYNQNMTEMLSIIPYMVSVLGVNLLMSDICHNSDASIQLSHMYIEIQSLFLRLQDNILEFSQAFDLLIELEDSVLIFSNKIDSFYHALVDIIQMLS